MNYLSKVTSNFRCDLIIICDDPRRETLIRKKKFDTYKAQRKPANMDVIESKNVLKEIIADLHLNYIKVDGYEADDVIGTLAKKYSEDGHDVVIATGDHDIMQLINDNVGILNLSAKDGITLMYDSEFYAVYGFSPKQLIDYKAIVGDTSDNYFGCPGIGKLLGSEIILKYSNLDNILNLTQSEIDCDSAIKRIHNNIESVKMSYDLATIYTDIDGIYPFTEDTVILNRDEVANVFRKHDIVGATNVFLKSPLYKGE
jgi:DNA polymerase-1